MDGSGGQSFHCTKMSPGLDDWREEVSRSSPHSSLIRLNRSRSRSSDHRFKMEGEANDTSSYYNKGKSQAEISHLCAYHGADSYRIVEGSSNDVLTEKKYHMNVAGTLSDDIPDNEICERHEFECKGIQSSRGDYAARAFHPLLSANADCHFDPGLKENATGLQILPLLVLEKASGMTTASSIGGRREEGLPKERENGQSQGLLEGDAKVDESITIDEEKASRAFRFALVEYIKDLLKPYWKQGILSKDAHKIIAKKAVHKVIESFGASQVPQTKSLTSKYLSRSRTNLDKLVQAYVEKYQMR